MRFVYLAHLGVPRTEIYGIINIDHITAIYEHEEGLYHTVINLSNNRQFRSVKYIQEILEILRENNDG